jgi:hypothetical protein
MAPRLDLACRPPGLNVNSTACEKRQRRGSEERRREGRSTHAYLACLRIVPCKRHDDRYRTSFRFISCGTFVSYSTAPHIVFAIRCPQWLPLRFGNNVPSMALHVKSEEHQMGAFWLLAVLPLPLFVALYAKTRLTPWRIARIAYKASAVEAVPDTAACQRARTAS